MESYLPKLNVLTGTRKGRCVYEGYQRGWGLQHGGLREKVAADPVYQRAMAVAGSRSVMTEFNRMNIYLILRFFLAGIGRGHLIEFGSYLGGNALFMAAVTAELHPGIQVYALDTFAGMPATDKAVDAHNLGDFSGVDVEELRAYASRNGLDNLEFVVGLFEDTAPRVLPAAGPIALAHIDCDIHPSVQCAYEAVKPHMVAGGYLVFDDATVSSCIGATEAVEDLLIRRDGLNSEQIFPHFVFRAPGA